MRTIDQQYADIVRQKVLEIQPDPNYKKYGAMAHKLPVLIYTAGLLQALEFVCSRGEDIQKRLVEHLALTIGQQNTSALIEAVREADLRGYMLLTRQALAALLWYKRFAQSILKVAPTEDASGDTTNHD
jgi:CRISPR-associated protein Cmr5